MSRPNITRLTAGSPSVQSVNYFVDANVWIYSMQERSLLDWWQRLYVDFFYEIVDSNLDPQPKLLMPTLLFSEILNTYLKVFAVPEYKVLNGMDKDAPINFKKDYRPTQHYKDSYEKVCDDIDGLRSATLFIDDSLIVSNPPLYLSPAVDPFDFNDYLYYQICREFQKTQPLMILTNDGDFQITDIPIITLNRDLLDF